MNPQADKIKQHTEQLLKGAKGLADTMSSFLDNEAKKLTQEEQIKLAEAIKNTDINSKIVELRNKINGLNSIK